MLISTIIIFFIQKGIENKISIPQIEDKVLEPKFLWTFLCVKSYNRDNVGLTLACLNINKIGEMDSKYPFLLLQFKGK